MTNLPDDGSLAANVMYEENWLKAEYRLNPKFKGLLTLMTSSAYDNIKTDKNYLRTSYGVIPTVYYIPFKDIDVQFS
ncbi:hypothetical protein LB456_00985 [Psychroflexus sp. CAK57W]|uniref:hypothetical protein n=1 Tax=Psychroflexus curvus TaxID=2873595 RepID=UPI001CCC80F0|nr:hypothetical protein [Psychroflexus curvus]MBZ9627533.1 hypothetical protein [Psychroflexus curvus]MBZ9786020.1 hypothetical protein [Psychroflexus curvus]